MSKSIIEFTPILRVESDLTENQLDNLYGAIERLKRDLSYILSQFEERIKKLEG